MLLGAGGLVAAAGWLSEQRFAFQLSPAPAAAAMPLPAYGPETYGAAVTQAQQDVGRWRARLEAGPNQWTRMEGLAAALLALDRLQGTAAHSSEIDRLLETGLAAAPEPSGPTLLAAEVALSRHDLPAVRVLLDRAEESAAPTKAERAVTAGFRGEIAFQHGSLRDAAQHFAEAADLAPGFGSQSRLAHLALWRGDPVKADRLAADALRTHALPPATLARALMMRADIAYARGGLEAAGKHIALASARFRGAPALVPYLAQRAAAQGRWSDAIASLEAYLGTHDDPEAADLLAGFHRHRGNDDDAARWSRIAGAWWDEKLRDAPDAWRLHAAEHHLDFGDPEKALRLARVEAARRPFGPALEVLASAYTANDRPRDALAVLDHAHAAGWRSVSLHMARAEAQQALGDRAAADAAVKSALALNPHADKPMRKLLRFGHY